MQRRAEPRDCREALGLVGQRPKRREKACPLNSGLVTGLHGLSPVHLNGVKHTHSPVVSTAPPYSAATFLAALAIFPQAKGIGHQTLVASGTASCQQPEGSSWTDHSRGLLASCQSVLSKFL